MRMKWNEVSVTMQEREVVLDASSRNDRVYCLPYGNSLLTKKPKVSRCLDRNIVSAYVDLSKGIQRLPNQVKFPLVSYTLQDLDHYQIANGQTGSTKHAVQQIHLGSFHSSKVVDPNAGINEDHLSVLMSSRSPSHMILPRSCRACSCRRK
jgi:hypothetical protein